MTMQQAAAMFAVLFASSAVLLYVYDQITRVPKWSQPNKPPDPAPAPSPAPSSPAPSSPAPSSPIAQAGAATPLRFPTPPANALETYMADCPAVDWPLFNRTMRVYLSTIRTCADESAATTIYFMQPGRTATDRYTRTPRYITTIKNDTFTRAQLAEMYGEGCYTAVFERSIDASPMMRCEFYASRAAAQEPTA